MQDQIDTQLKIKKTNKPSTRQINENDLRIKGLQNTAQKLIDLTDQIMIYQDTPPPNIIALIMSFAVTKEKCGRMELEFAQQVNRTLVSRKEAFTFRNFIKECLRRFESGDFGILTANQVLIDKP